MVGREGSGIYTSQRTLVTVRVGHFSFFKVLVPIRSLLRLAPKAN